jgi:hypothetical protein
MRTPRIDGSVSMVGPNFSGWNQFRIFRTHNRSDQRDRIMAKHTRSPTRAANQFATRARLAEPKTISSL